MLYDDFLFRETDRCMFSIYLLWFIFIFMYVCFFYLVCVCVSSGILLIMLIIYWSVVEYITILFTVDMR